METLYANHAAATGNSNEFSNIWKADNLRKGAVRVIIPGYNL